jgi:transposase, IS5 family
MPGSSTTPGRADARAGASARVAFRLVNGVSARGDCLSRLDGWPMRPPVNASPLTSRPDAHDSGPVWVATPSLQRTCTVYSLPVSRRTHKLNLTTGQSGLILDLVIEAGNPADSDRFWPMLERHIGAYGAAPRQAAADGGFASRKNLDRAKACGVRDMAFHKKSGLSIEDMVRSRWVYRKLRNFRAGIEAGISCLKRAYGLARCTWRGLDHFKAYVWSSVVAYNLVVFVRLRSA